MLKILGKAYRHCDGVRRRDFLTAGAITLGGLTLADLLRAEAAAGIKSSAKAIINIHLDGGPPQMDMIDPKPEAPVEIRGEFKPIATKIAGLRVCELMPKVASIADKFAFIRSLVGSAGAHDAFQCQSGFPANNLQSLGGRPALGARLVGELHARRRRRHVQPAERRRHLAVHERPQRPIFAESFDHHAHRAVSIQQGLCRRLLWHWGCCPV